MQIAVIDNERLAAEHLCSLLEMQPYVSQIHIFLDISQFFDMIDRGSHFDVVFMDIEWNQEKNGIDFASRICENYPNTQIIYVTGYNDRFSQKIFLKPSNLCGYLVKPVDPELFAAMLEKARIEIHQSNDHKLFIQRNGATHAIPFRDICYLESNGHQLTIHTFHDDILYYRRLEDVKQQLPDYFFQCHKSYIVNMSLIRRMERFSISLESGQVIPVSKSRYQETRAAYFRYIGKVL